jgi:hypothetical protein
MRLRALLVAVLALGLASEGRAQWSAPSFLPPRPADDIGIYFSSIEGFGVQGIWRQHGNLNLGVRAGWIDGHSPGGIVAAVESWGLLFQAEQVLPVDVAWTVGAGAVFDDATSLEVPVGLSVGRSMPMGRGAVQLYAHPRIALIVRTDPDETEIGGLFDLGADVVSPGRMTLRLGATLGSFDALGLGIAIPWGRRVEVR